MSKPGRSKYYKNVKIGNENIVAFLIGTGSDFLIRANQYLKLKSPDLTSPSVMFRGISSNDYKTFETKIEIDNEYFSINIAVVPNGLMRHSLLIGIDFIDRV